VSAGRSRVHYAWVVLAVVFVALLAAQGARLAFGAFVAPWERDFQVSRGAISLVSLVSFLVYGLSQPLSGRLIDRLGVRKVFAASLLLVGLSVAATAAVRSPVQLALLYGVLASVGFGGASGVAATVAVTHWFSARRGLALGLVEAGFGAGQLVLVPTSLVLIDVIGWRATLLAVGAVVALVVFPLALLLVRSSPADKATRPFGDDGGVHPGGHPDTKPQTLPNPGRSSAHGGSDRAGLLRARAFWGLALPFFVCGITTTGMIDTHLVPFAHDHGYSTAVAGTAVSLLAACNIAGTLASGPLVDRFDGRLILGGLYAVRALSLGLLLAAASPGWLLAFGVVFGLVDFATVAPTTVLASRYFADRSLGVVVGLLYLSHQVGSALGAWVPGLLHDLTGGYTASFDAAIVALAVASLLSFRLPTAPAPRPMLSLSRTGPA
jgi:MFS family permease